MPSIIVEVLSAQVIRAEHADADSEPCALLGAGREVRPDHTADPGQVRSYRPHVVCHERTEADRRPVEAMAIGQTVAAKRANASSRDFAVRWD